MKYLNSDKVKLKTDKSAHGIEFSFPRFPFLGLWAAKNANFVCIEPWCGIADSTTTDQQFINKEGINLLTPGEEFSRRWSVRCFNTLIGYFSATHPGRIAGIVYVYRRTDASTPPSEGNWPSLSHLLKQCSGNRQSPPSGGVDAARAVTQKSLCCAAG